MVRSLRQFVPDATTWVLCLSSTAYDILNRIAEPGVRPIALRDFEAGDAPLAAAKQDGRSQIEYYFTCTPSLIRYVMRAAPQAELVTYLDSDLGFFADPEPIYQEAGNAPIIVVPHRFPPALRHREIYGIYNVGWVSFRHNDEAISCIEWWRARCLEWCSDRVDSVNQRFADQRYLDQFPAIYPGTHVLRHKGANLAPWNLGADKISLENGRVIVAGRDPLIFFHFHGLKTLDKRTVLTALEAYRVPLTSIIRKAIYLPYLKEIRRIENELAPFLPEVPKALRELAGGSSNMRGARLKNRLRGLRAFITRSYIRLPPDPKPAADR